ncbi:helix-turn-helix domain-containing protein [Streptomyces sp. ISL-112]|uniref:helix-turn-helix domain-containing protein n=1 Tax=unclassified Streptomyces TaxID=2593676 RepID=UPI001BE738E9|nr:MULTISPECIES: helix-turn-helix transcriptional regulator [unclassified Streptomyces]MBT2429388.1 helix-turn-helix domain-containing protein [Streptomyces sp. ISL-112]MBT2463980.1 helix-turn-helix domain-containing protein [Streptomyces sp. ISL-63]
MSDNDRFAEWLRSARSASGLSQGKVADAMNAEGFVFYQQTIAKVESGERPVRLDEATALARIFGADLSDTLGVTASASSKLEPSTEGDSTTLSISARVIEKLRDARRANSVSARALAEAMTEAGYPIQRSVIANTESGRRAEVSVDHLVAAARALGVDPSVLLRKVTDPCPHCHGAAPRGFTCNTCGGSA